MPLIGCRSVLWMCTLLQSYHASGIAAENVGRLRGASFNATRSMRMFRRRLSLRRTAIKIQLIRLAMFLEA